MGAAFPKKPDPSSPSPSSPPTGTGSPTSPGNPGDDMLKFRLPQPDESKDVMVKRLALLTSKYPGMTDEYVKTTFNNLLLKQNFIKKKKNLILIVTAIVSILLIGIAIVYYTMRGRTQIPSSGTVEYDYSEDDGAYTSETQSSERPDERGPPPSRNHRERPKDDSDRNRDDSGKKRDRGRDRERDREGKEREKGGDRKKEKRDRERERAPSTPEGVDDS